MNEKESIRFKNLFLKHVTGWFRNNPLGSVGNIIHWIYVYGNLSIAENIEVNTNQVYYMGKLLCEFYESSKHNIPVFHGFDKEYKWVDDNQDVFLRQLNNLLVFQKEELFEDSKKYFSDEDLKLLKLKKNETDAS